MSGGAVVDPFDVLSRLSERAQAVARPLPQLSSSAFWVGIGVEVSGQRFVIPIAQINEILRSTEITALPGVKPWVLGLGQLRGAFFTVVDLQAYWRERKHPISDQARILYLRRPRGSYAILVDGILGLRHFKENQRCDAPKLSIEVEEAFKDSQGRLWPILSLEALVESSEFQKVALEATSSHEDKEG